MPQYVIEFGAEKVWSIGESIGANLVQPYKIQIDSSDRKMWYTDTAKEFREVLNDLEIGSATSIIIRNSDPRIRYALITSPTLHVPQLRLWMGTIEIVVSNWWFAWDLLLKQNGLRFVCVGAEEGVEIGDEHINPDTFPWTASKLLAGAVRSDEESEWTIRERASRSEDL